MFFLWDCRFQNQATGDSEETGMELPYHGVHSCRHLFKRELHRNQKSSSG